MEYVLPWKYLVVVLISNSIIIKGDDSDSEQETNADNTVPEKMYTTGIEVELTISAQNLPRSDWLGLAKCDPMCVIQTPVYGTSQLTEYQRTEKMENEQNPTFQPSIKMLYKFEEQQPLIFRIYDVDSASKELEEQKLLGSTSCPLGQLVLRGEMTLTLQKKGLFGGMEDTESSITIRVTEVAQNHYERVTMQLSGKNLDDSDWLGKSDPFIEIYNPSKLVYTTEVITNDLNPRWKRFFISVKTLCDDNYDESLRFVCWNSNSMGSHDLIGEFKTTLNELNQDTKEFALINEDKNDRNSGEVHIEFFKVATVRSLIEYFHSGLQIRCTVAIDFTDSNRDPSDSDSLHHTSSSKETFNQYEQIMSSIVSIIEPYSSDKQFQVLGFGARLPSSDSVSQDFPINMKDSTPFCSGVDGILEAYRDCVSQIQFDETRKFIPVIQRVINSAGTQENNNEYHILLILTHGSPSDLEETKEAIIDASELPMSIIMVGVGEADFDAVEALDMTRFRVNGAEAQRDITRFIRFKNFQSEGNLHTAGLHLAKEALSRIPEQITSYMVTV